jgi:hypothetical protein
MHTHSLALRPTHALTMRQTILRTAARVLPLHRQSLFKSHRRLLVPHQQAQRGASTLPVKKVSQWAYIQKYYLRDSAVRHTRAETRACALVRSIARADVLSLVRLVVLDWNSLGDRRTRCWRSSPVASRSSASRSPTS